MAITWEDVVAIAPELASYAMPGQTAVLRMVGLQVSADTWDMLADTGAAYLAAHLATLTRRRGEGPKAESAVGQLSVSYAPLLEAAGLYGTTAYGVEYIRLCRLLPTALGLTL